MKQEAIRDLFLENVRNLETEAAVIRRYEALGDGQLAPKAHYSSLDHYRFAAQLAFAKLPAGVARARSIRPPKRGDRLPSGGRFVGLAPGNVAWVSYEGEGDFRRMCVTFDARFSESIPRRGAAAA